MNIIILIYFINIIIQLHFLLLPSRKLFYYSLKRDKFKKKLKNIFPLKKYKSYHILKAYIEQSDFHNNVIIQTVYNNKKNNETIYNLWLLLPFSLTFPFKIYKSNIKFHWIISIDFETIFIITHLFVKILKKEKYINNWLEFQTIYINEILINKVSIFENFLIIKTNNKLLKLYSNNNYYYNIEKLLMNQCLQNFNIFSKCYKNNFLILSNPEYNNLNGIVYIYQFISNNYLILKQTIIDSLSSTYFGKHCEIITINSNLYLLISAIFTPTPLYGSGSINIYQYKNDQFILNQIINCPETYSNEFQYVLNFGTYFVTSNNGIWLAIFSKYKCGRIYLYKFCIRRNQYLKHNIIKYEHPSYNMLKSNISVDPNGHVILTTNKNVYICFNHNHEIISKYSPNSNYCINT